MCLPGIGHSVVLTRVYLEEKYIYCGLEMDEDIELALYHLASAHNPDIVWTANKMFLVGSISSKLKQTKEKTFLRTWQL